MTLTRVSVLLPGKGWDDFPTHLGNDAAAELLAAWTTAWHPALLAETGCLPVWHQAEEPPDPAALENELVLVPRPSRDRMPADWCDRLRATSPKNPPPVETVASRAETVAAALSAAGTNPQEVDASVTADFLALGYAYMLVELLTRAMRYSSVLDTAQFQNAVVVAAKAAVAGNLTEAHDELARAFDLLADARHHVYSVDFYIIDVTLLADSTLGEPLQAKLAAGSPTNLLIAGEQIERMAQDQSATFAELKRVVAAGTAAIIGGKFHRTTSTLPGPEGLLAELRHGQATAQQHLGREYQIFGQFDSAFTPLLPEVLRNLGFRGALHTSFDGAKLPRAEQRKTNWGVDKATSIEALTAPPLDAAQPETWLKLAERIGDTLARDHVATILLASWPGTECEYFDDLRRVARFGTVLGKLITLEEYFEISRQPDDWVHFNPRSYPNRSQFAGAANLISSSVSAYREEFLATHRQLGEGLAQSASLSVANPLNPASDSQIAINGWSFPASYVLGVGPLGETTTSVATANSANGVLLPDVLGCGYRAINPPVTINPVTLAEGLVLRNERLELTVNKKTGGIQSLRLHRDRSTRVSQRLVFHQQHGPVGESQMVAGRVEVTRNDELVGEITSMGRILDAKSRPLANYTQRVRVVRGLVPIIVEVELDPQQLPDGNLWASYFGSRLAWADDALSIRVGAQCSGRETEREQIESPEWVEIDDLIGRITIFPLGLPFHRRSSTTWLDTLLLPAGEEHRRFQFAIGLDVPSPTQAACALLSAGQPFIVEMPSAASAPKGWFLHVGAKNAIITHIEPLGTPPNGVRLRIFETEGRDTRTAVSAFRPFRTANLTDFRGQPLEVLSVVDGAAQLDLGPNRWLQIEAEW